MKMLNCYFEFRKNDNTLFLSDNISKIHNYEHFQQKNKFKFITGLWLARIAIYFKCLNLEAGLRTQRLITKRECHKVVIWTHNRNKQTSSTAGNAWEQDNMDYKCVTGGFLGAEWKINEAEKPLFCKSHDGSTRSISF